MKRTTKRILVLMLCITLFFTSAHSIYSSTFTLDVQAAEVVITAEVAASVLEYLWALLLSMGLVSAAVSWSDRIPQINETMDLLAAYPEITADMTIEVTVNGKVLEVTYDQYMTYIKHHVVDGTGAVQTGSEVFTVLSGGGGKNGGDKEHKVELLAQGAGQFLIYKMLMTAEQLRESSVYEPTPEELEIINAVYAELVSGDIVTISENTMTIHNYSEAAQKLLSDISYHFDIGQDYNGAVCVDETAAGGGHCVAVGAYAQDGCMRGGSFYRQIIAPDDTAYAVLCIAPTKKLTYDGKNDGYNLGIAVVEFTGSETAQNAYGGMDFDTWKAYPYNMYPPSVASGFEASSVETGSVPTAVSEYPDFCMKDTSVNLRTGTVYTRMSGMNWNFLCQPVNGGYTSTGFGNGISDGKAHDVDFYIHTVGQHGMPVLLLNDMQLLPAVCNGLLEKWDNNVFANYSGRTQLFTPKALSQVSKPALEGLAKALLHGGISTDAAIDAATEIDALREIEPARLPEFYPDLYPEYLPEADPAEYPEIYPDYDPVTNPNPAPALPPNPDRVVEDVTQTATNPNPTPNPNPDEGTDGSLDNADLEGAAFNLSEYFPFCVPFDLIRAFKLLTAEAEAPYWEIPLHAEFLGYVIDYTFVIDMSKFEMLAKIFRLCETISFCVGLILLTRNIIRG